MPGKEIALCLEMPTNTFIPLMQVDLVKRGELQENQKPAKDGKAG